MFAPTSSPPSVVKLPPFLRNERYLVRHDRPGHRDNIVGERHLQVEFAAHHVPQTRYIEILDMPPVLPQVHGDSGRPVILADDRPGYRIGLDPSPGLSQRRDMIDIHAKNRFPHFILSAAQCRPFSS